MSGLFGTFNTLKRALGANQYALNTTSHNIANANTEGYSRQTVQFQASRPQTIPGIAQLGTGVDIGAVSRARDSFLDVQIRNQLGTLGRFEARDEFLTNIEVIFMEPSENGLSKASSRMWDAWQDLANSPESSNARTGVLEISQSFTDQMNITYKQLEKLQNDSGSIIQKRVFDFNGLITELTDLNRQIAGVKMSGALPNDLLDRRDLIVDKISQMMDIQVHTVQPAPGELDLDQITITAGNGTIVGPGQTSLSYIKGFEDQGDGTYKMTYYNIGDITNSSNQKTEIISTAEYDKIKDDKMIWTDSSGNVVRSGGVVKQVVLQDGSLKGYNSIHTEIQGYMDSLNAMARAMAVAVNTVHNDGKVPGQAGYLAFFTTDSSVSPADESKLTAGNITVNPYLKDHLSEIHAEADYARAQTDPNYKNGDRALAISRVRDAVMDINFFSGQSFDRSTNPVVSKYTSSDMKISPNTAGTTVDDFFQDLIGKLGSSSRQAKGMVENQEALVNQLQTRKESISGVSMDEEMANLIQYQRSYDAAARTITVLDELLQSILGLIR